MPNWCAGTLRVRGTKENMTKFILEGLHPVGFLGEEHPKLLLNEMLTRVDEDELFDIRCKSWNFCIQETKWEITHSDTFMDNHFGDMLVTHIEVNDSPRGHEIMLLVDQGDK